MTPDKFISDWKHSTLNERQGAQTHFNQLCALIDVPEPSGTSLRDGYGFEVNVDKVGGGQGYADAWKRGCFAWEYKSPGSDLGQALRQLKLYASDLENPPLLIVSGMRRIEIHTNWTNMVQETHTLALDDLADARLRQKLKWAFSEDTVAELKPRRSANATTEEVARDFVRLAQNLRERGHAPEQVAHFVNRMVFCMFAEDVDLLPKKMFQRMLEASLGDPGNFVRNAEALFKAMATRGHGRLRPHRVVQRRAVRRPRGAAADWLIRHPSRAGCGGRRTGPRSILRSWARCSSAGSIRPNARSSARTTPTPRRSC